jgi:NADPH-dependent ferric siderophore reductase
MAMKVEIEDAPSRSFCRDRLRWGRGAKGGEECRLLGPGRGQIRQFDVTEAADLLGQSGELDGKPVVVGRETGDELVDHGLVFCDEAALDPALLAAAERVEHRAAEQGSIVADGSQQLRNERAGRCGVPCKSVAKRAPRA